MSRTFTDTIQYIPHALGRTLAEVVDDVLSFLRHPADEVAVVSYSQVYHDDLDAVKLPRVTNLLQDTEPVENKESVG